MLRFFDGMVLRCVHGAVAAQSYCTVRDRTVTIEQRARNTLAGHCAALRAAVAVRAKRDGVDNDQGDNIGTLFHHTVAVCTCMYARAKHPPRCGSAWQRLHGCAEVYWTAVLHHTTLSSTLLQNLSSTQPEVDGGLAFAGRGCCGCATPAPTLACAANALSFPGRRCALPRPMAWRTISTRSTAAHVDVSRHLYPGAAMRNEALAVNHNATYSSM